MGQSSSERDQPRGRGRGTSEDTDPASAAVWAGTLGVCFPFPQVLCMGTQSVFVDNATGSAISVLTDSLFSGILLGV